MPTAPPRTRPAGRTRLRRVLLISFDYLRRGEPQASYPLACLSTAVLADPDLWRDWAVDVVTIDLARVAPLGSRGLASLIQSRARFDRYDVIAFGDYCWSTQYVADLVGFLMLWQPAARLVAGGYQVTSTPDAHLVRHYPHPERLHFLKGFAEASLCVLLRAISSGADLPHTLSEPISCAQLASPWLAGELPLEPMVRSVRWETKRGCQYRCDYCEFKSAKNSPWHAADMVLDRDRLLGELELFRQAGIRKVNVLDPLFNIEDTYEALLEPMLQSGLSFTLQTRIERLERQDDLIEAASGNPKLRLEIGVQTLNDELNRLLCRANKKDLILSTLSRLKERRVSFETNLIFGIPGQTVRSHIEDLEALMAAGCPKEDIRCFPLRIPRGSQLEARKESMHVKESGLAGTDAVVTRADGFDELDWHRMVLASELGAGYLEKLSALVTEEPRTAESRTTMRALASDIDAWRNALDTHGYRFKVMVASKDGTYRRHSEPGRLRFLQPDRVLNSLHLTPGWAQFIEFASALAPGKGKSESPAYVLLRKRLGPFVQERPARVVARVLDVSNRRLVVYVTWRVQLREGLRLLRWLKKKGIKLRARMATEWIVPALRPRGPKDSPPAK